MKRLVLIFFIVFVSCDSEKKYKKLNDALISNYTSISFKDKKLDYLYKEQIKKTFELVEKMNDLSKSKNKYLFNLMKMRLYCYQGKVDKSINELNSIKSINPKMYSMYKGMIYEFKNNNIKSVEYYNKAISYNEDKDEFYFFLKYLLNKNFRSYKNSICSFNKDICKFLNFREEEFKGDSILIRKSILIDEFFNNFTIPYYKD